jgi:hypothetical protein|tara:strand:+ start:523 stop:915 length:393 start_codon:yes stop_codon:yes gene_type:complete
MGDLKKWVNEKWVDIGAPKKNGKYQPCGRKSASSSKRKYPKCVPLAKATRMTSSQKASAVSRKRAAGNPGGKPTNVSTFTKRDKKAKGGSVGNSMIKQAQRDYKGSYISGSLGGVKVGNPSLKKYYKGML